MILAIFFFFCLRTDVELEVEAAIAQLEAGVRNQFQFFVENLVPEPSQIEPQGLQNRARGPPRRNFSKMFDLRGSKWAAPAIF